MKKELALVKSFLYKSVLLCSTLFISLSPVYILILIYHFLDPVNFWQRLALISIWFLFLGGLQLTFIGLWFRLLSDMLGLKDNG